MTGVDGLKKIPRNFFPGVAGTQAAPLRLLLGTQYSHESCTHHQKFAQVVPVKEGSRAEWVPTTCVSE